MGFLADIEKFLGIANLPTVENVLFVELLPVALPSAPDGTPGAVVYGWAGMRNADGTFKALEPAAYLTVNGQQTTAMGLPPPGLTPGHAYALGPAPGFVVGADLGPMRKSAGGPGDVDFSGAVQTAQQAAQQFAQVAQQFAPAVQTATQPFVQQAQAAVTPVAQQAGTAAGQAAAQGATSSGNLPLFLIGGAAIALGLVMLASKKSEASMASVDFSDYDHDALLGLGSDHIANADRTLGYTQRDMPHIQDALLGGKFYDAWDMATHDRKRVTQVERDLRGAEDVAKYLARNPT